MSSLPEQHLPISQSAPRRKKKIGHPRHLKRNGSWDDIKDFSSTALANTDTDIDNNININTQLFAGTRLLTHDFVVRSLRRRLWKAFREDDVDTATRAYQATLPDFVRWLEEEHQEKRNHERMIAVAAKKKEAAQDVAIFKQKQQQRQRHHYQQQQQRHRQHHPQERSRSRSTSPTRSFEHPSNHPRRLSFDTKSAWCNERDTNKPLRRGRRPDRGKTVEIEREEQNNCNYHQFDSNDYRYELLKHQHQQRMETESMIGGPTVSILQSLMNPSDPFIADDFLSPYDDATYDHLSRKCLPDPIKHEAEQQAMEAEKKRRKKAKSPRTAFRRMIMVKSKRSNRERAAATGNFSYFDATVASRIAEDADIPATNILPLESNNVTLEEEDDPSWMTTPLHEAARVGAEEFVRLLLANGGDPNTKNGVSQTAFHLCAGGYTTEEEQLVEAADAAVAAKELAAEEKDEEYFRTITTEDSTIVYKKKKKRYRKNSKAKPPPSLSIDAASEVPMVTSISGIPPTVIPKESLELMRTLDSDMIETTKDQKKPAPSKSKSKRRLLGKMLSFRNRKEKIDHNGDIMEEDTELDCELNMNMLSLHSQSNQTQNHRQQHNNKPIESNPQRFHELVNDRMEAMVALLAFEHRETGEGPSINAVDHNGRTSLHYAAELGRTSICTAMLSHFGIMLTIVDEMGTRTPCEVAEHHNHTALAALLEARALLYVDPYGLDDEMLDMINVANEGGNSYGNNGNGKRKNPNGRLVPPYRWFITLSKEEIANERVTLLGEAREKLAEAFLEAEDEDEEEEEDTKQSINHTIYNNGFNGPRNAPLEPYVTSPATTTILVNGQQQLKPPPPSDNQETIDIDDGEKKPAALGNEEAIQSDDVETATTTTMMKSDSVFTVKKKNECDRGGDECQCKNENSDKQSDFADDHESSDRNSPRNSLLPNMQDCDLEQYMTHHKWELSAALDAFRENRAEAFNAAGIQINSVVKKEEEKSETESNACLCPICYDDEVEKKDWIVLRNCGHGFCRDCLTDYAAECANNRTPLHLITCPDHNCQSGLSNLDLQSVLEKDHPEIFDRISVASTDNFITSHTNFRFCPHPGCSGVVHRFRQPKWASADHDEHILNYTGAVCTAVTPSMEKIGSECTLTYEGVEDLDYTNCRSLQQPKKAHRFCFTCGEGVHWPLTCERLAEWKQRISDEIGKVDDKDGNGESDFNELAQKIWLKANTRPCPQCQIPIEKADGCNHMVCHSCHHEFCWICRQDWRLHSTDTGGFFRCNIWTEDDPERSLDKQDGDDDDEQLNATTITNQNFFEGMINDHGYGSSMHTSRKAWKKKQDIKRFLHHYSRWEAHADSNRLEKKMADTVCIRLAPVVEAAIDFDGRQSFNFGGKGLSFLHNAFFELAECRSTLRHSYAFSFYRYPSKTFTKPSASRSMSYLGNKKREKFRFERLQSELETLTEQMSDIVARSRLRASQIQITYMTSGAAEKRLELNNFLFQIYREEKRNALRQKRRESEKAAEENKKEPAASSAQYTPYATLMSNNNNNDTEVPSTSQEMFRRLMQIHDEQYEQITTPYGGREVTMRLHQIGEQLRGMEDLLRSQRARNRMIRNNYNNSNAAEPRFVYRPADDGDGDDENRYPRNEPAEMWACSLCTFMNTGGSFCAMCETPR